MSAQGRCWLAECDRCRRCLSCSHRALCFLHTGHHRLAPSAPLPHRLVTVLQLVSFVLYNLFWPAVFDCCASLFDCDWPDLRSGMPAHHVFFEDHGESVACSAATAATHTNHWSIMAATSCCRHDVVGALCMTCHHAPAVGACRLSGDAAPGPHAVCRRGAHRLRRHGAADGECVTL